MDPQKIYLAVIIFLFTFISGWADSRGFLHASQMWQEGRIVWDEFWKSALGFFIGIGSYWVVVKFLREIGIVSPEIQTVGWFAVTIIGLAISSGKFMHWHLLDQVISIAVVLGLGILIIRTGG